VRPEPEDDRLGAETELREPEDDRLGAEYVLLEPDEGRLGELKVRPGEDRSPENERAPLCEPERALDCSSRLEVYGEGGQGDDR
jgi:hypothetical protein